VSLGREQGFKLDLHLRCHCCWRMAYVDDYEGELDADGYLCLGCVREENQRLGSALANTGESIG